MGRTPQTLQGLKLGLSPLCVPPQPEATHTIFWGAQFREGWSSQSHPSSLRRGAEAHPTHSSHASSEDLPFLPPCLPSPSITAIPPPALSASLSDDSLHNRAPPPTPELHLSRPHQSAAPPPCKGPGAISSPGGIAEQAPPPSVSTPETKLSFLKEYLLVLMNVY